MMSGGSGAGPACRDIVEDGNGKRLVHIEDEAAQDGSIARITRGDALPRAKGIVASDICDALALELGVDEVGTRRHA